MSQESIEKKVPVPANEALEQDVNACLAVVNTFKEMVDNNRAQYDKKVEAWEAGRAALSNEYNLGRNPPSRGFGNSTGGAQRPSISCEGEGNYFTFLGSRQGSWLDAIYGRCKNGTWVQGGNMRGGKVAFEADCPQGFTGVGTDPHGALVHRVAAKCGNQWHHASHLNPSHYTKWDCPPGTVLKRVDIRTGSKWDYLNFTCKPPNYKPGNWPTLTSYYEGKTGKTKPVFQPIPVNALPCQYCINKAANIAVDDSQKTEVIQSCANNIKQAQIEKAEKDAEEKKIADETAAKEAPKENGNKTSNGESQNGETKNGEKSTEMQSSNNSSLYILGGSTMVSFCSIFVVLLGVIIYLLTRKK